MLEKLEVLTDSDWAGDKRTRKSTSCAVLVLDDCVLCCICRGQSVRAQSSGEAEVYAAVTGMKETLHVQELLAWMGEPLRVRLKMDSSAGRSTLQRKGVGKQRHLEVKILWSQDMCESGRVIVDKIRGDDNTSDIGTKPLSAQVFERHRGWLGLMKIKSLVGAVFLNVLGIVAGSEVCPYQQPETNPSEEQWMVILFFLIAAVSIVLGCVFLLGVFYGRATAIRAEKLPERLLSLADSRD